MVDVSERCKFALALSPFVPVIWRILAAGLTPQESIRTQEHFVLISKYERREVLPARWGLVSRNAKDNSRTAQCITAMAEAVDTRPPFKEAFYPRRCIVPAHGFSEWRGPPGALAGLVSSA
jgi:putative SOS response-associated peptidase YedK